MANFEHLKRNHPRKQLDASKVILDGTQRGQSPGITIERVLAIKDLVGITRYANITGLDKVGIPVWAVYRPNSKSNVVSLGKGLDSKLSLASGLMEATEVWHAEMPLRRTTMASYMSLAASSQMVSPGSLPTVNGMTFDGDLPIMWVSAIDLNSGELMWLPNEIVSANYTSNRTSKRGIFLTSSNGLASGNVLYEAIVHALTETVERDAYAHWEYSEGYFVASNRLRLNTVDNDHCIAVISTLKNAELDVAVWYATTDLEIPVFICWIMDSKANNGGYKRSSIGFGCHLNKHVALSRALTEAAQDRLTVISGARDDLNLSDFTPPGQEVQSIRERIINEIDPALSYLDIASYQHSTFEEDVVFLLATLKARGLDKVLIVDLTCDSVQIPVVKVVVPGLEPQPDLKGYVPGPRATRAAVK